MIPGVDPDPESDFQPSGDFGLEFGSSKKWNRNTSNIFIHSLGEVPFEAGAEALEALVALRGAVGRRRPRREDAAHDGQRRSRIRRE